MKQSLSSTGFALLALSAAYLWSAAIAYVMLPLLFPELSFGRSPSRIGDPAVVTQTANAALILLCFCISCRLVAALPVRGPMRYWSLCVLATGICYGVIAVGVAGGLSAELSARI